MSERTPKLLETVALLRDLSGAGLRRGQVGAVVEILDDETVLVEFADAEGRSVSVPTIAPRDLLVLDYGQAAAE